MWPYGKRAGLLLRFLFEKPIEFGEAVPHTASKFRCTQVTAVSPIVERSDCSLGRVSACLVEAQILGRLDRRKQLTESRRTRWPSIERFIRGHRFVGTRSIGMALALYHV